MLEILPGIGPGGVLSETDRWRELGGCWLKEFRRGRRWGRCCWIRCTGRFGLGEDIPACMLEPGGLEQDGEVHWEELRAYGGE